MISQNQSQAQNYNQNVPQQASHTVFFNDQPRATMDHSENYTFFQQNKNMSNKHLTRNQPHYSDDEEYYGQNQQRFSTNQNNIMWNFDQPDPIYQPDFCKYDKQDIKPTSCKNNFQTKNPSNTQCYQPTQTQNEIPLPY